MKKIYEKLFSIGLKGMNIGQGDSPSNSGEKWVIDNIYSKIASKPRIFFDVGAHTGEYSKEILKHDFQVYAFEPSKVSFDELKTQVNFQAFNIGFGDKTEEKILYSDSAGSSLASIYNRRLSHFGLETKSEEKVKIDTLDNFCEKHEINRINVLKLDAEGNEFSILRGAEKMLQRGVIKYIQFEFGGCNIDSRTFFQDFWYLLSPKYKIYRILKNGLQPIGKYRESNEIFLNTNFLAELKDR